MVTDPDVYSVVEYCKRLCGGSGWPKELNKPLERLIKNVTEALLLLGRQQQCDQKLLSQLHVLTNHPERARAIAQELSARHPELHEDVRHWLEKGRLKVNRPASATAVEAVASRADESIGLALQVARELRATGKALREPLKSSLEIYEPGLLSPALSLVEQAERLTSEIEQVAGLRALDLHGVPGQEIDMSPKYFTPVGTEPRQRMTVRQPAVVRLRADGSLGDVITKGLVD
ncbi:hypothetical protein D621_02740 [beta proteobacterium AAP51]|nr:hypothetical protein D621_02740 [beta proteobacterium AAP51]